MGVLTFFSEVRSTKYAFAVIFILILGVYFLINNSILWGALLIIVGVLGLFSIKFFFKIKRRHAQYVEKTYHKKENIGVIIGVILGALGGYIYTFIQDIDLTPYTSGTYFILVPLVVGGLLGYLIQKITGK